MSTIITFQNVISHPGQFYNHIIISLSFMSHNRMFTLSGFVAVCPISDVLYNCQSLFITLHYSLYIFSLNYLFFVILYFIYNIYVLDRSGHQTDLRSDIFSLVNLATTPLLMSPDYSWARLPVYIIIFKH